MIVDIKQAVINALDSTGADLVSYARSKGDKRQPEASRQRGSKGVYYKYNYKRVNRPAHPGGWADVTGSLVNAYNYDIKQTGNKIALIVRNPVEYAKFLEGKERKQGGSYWVLKGLLEDDRPQRTFDRYLTL